MSVPYSKLAAAQVALRDAARALDDVDGLTTARDLAADIAYAVDATTALLLRRGDDGPASPSSSDRDLRELVRHLREGATLARRVSGGDDGAPSAAPSSRCDMRPLLARRHA